MTHREIRPTPDGFVVVELEPKVIARFASEQHAQIFCDVLDEAPVIDATAQQPFIGKGEAEGGG